MEKNIGPSVVVRRSTLTVGKNRHEIWPGMKLYVFGIDANDSDSFSVGEEGGRPIGSIPKNAMLRLTFNADGEIYFVDRVLAKDRFQMKGVRTGMTRIVTLHNFFPEISQAPDPIEEVQKCAYLAWAIGTYSPIPSNEDLDKAAA
ncbi:MAG: hypothetical protein G01um101425_891 [Candidatus Peregrinibacteria bacterium Gr01-1014_25]|nr:MAG: hypothetical protein G01um101425_891 [Candidatus Peregrinibacteria bacterium Gr01-1014_25]